MFWFGLSAVVCFEDLSILAYELSLSHFNVFTVFHWMNGILYPSDRQLDCLQIFVVTDKATVNIFAYVFSCTLERLFA